MNDWYVYILELSNGSLYTGITNDVHKRMKTHSEGKGSKCVRSFLPFILVYLEKVKNRSIASKREIEIKNLKKLKKLLLCSGENLASDDEWNLYKKEGNDLNGCSN